MVTRKNINTMIKNGQTNDVILAHQINDKEKKENSYGIDTLVNKMTHLQKEYAKIITRERIKSKKETIFGLNKDLTVLFVFQLFGDWEAKRLMSMNPFVNNG